MTQHFLLSAAARTLSLKEIYVGREEVAYRRLCLLRWPATNGKPVCPRCAWPEAYVLSSRRKYKCKACYHQFSRTSGAILASRKLAFVDLLGAIALLVHAAKGMSALQLSRCIDVSYKAAFVLAHKLREALAIETREIMLDATVERTAPISVASPSSQRPVRTELIGAAAPTGGRIAQRFDDQRLFHAEDLNHSRSVV